MTTVIIIFSAIVIVDIAVAVYLIRTAKKVQECSGNAKVESVGKFEDDAIEASTEEEIKRFHKEQDDAFRELLSYDISKAYGYGKGGKQ